MPAARHTRSRGPGIGLVLIFLVLGAAGVFGALWYMGWIDPLNQNVEAAAPPDLGNRILVPIAGVSVPAYTKIQTGHLYRQDRTGWAQIAMDPERIPESALVDRADIRGRVLAREKRANTVFTEDDFLPKGTREGIVAGIPPGKVGFYVELAKVNGLHELRTGDRFDLVATLPVETDVSDLRKLDVGGVHSSRMVLDASMSNSLKKATVDVIVVNGVVVRPYEVREVPYSVSTFTQGLVTRTRPVQEVLIAISPIEVSLLTEKIAVDAQVVAIPRSGHPEDPSLVAREQESEDSSLVGSDIPSRGGNEGGIMQGLQMVESIRGDKREIVAIPQSPSGGSN